MVWLLAGRTKDATEVAHEAFRLSQAQNEGGSGVRAMQVLGHVHARRDPPDLDAAAAWYRRMLTRAQELETRPYIAHAHLGLGTVARRLHTPADAMAHFTAAAGLYQEMNMSFWLQQARAELEAAGGVTV
jgi:hypothetical protein